MANTLGDKPLSGIASTETPVEAHGKLIERERVEAALQHVERVVALVRNAVKQEQLAPADAQKIIDAATAFGAAVIF